MVLVARPGTKLSDIESLCHSENQYFAFEPPAWGAAATIGGTVACNLSGPRRFKMGALRDHLLGAELIDGRGERIRTGGKVVKNVTGYDLSKVLAGSFGTLGVLTEVCLKVWPRPETQATLFVPRADARSGVGANSRLGGAAPPDHGPSLRRRPVSRPRREARHQQCERN